MRVWRRLRTSCFAEVVAVEVEVELDVGEAEDADGAHLIEVRCAVQRGFDGHGDLLLHLFGGPGGVLGDDLDERWRGVGVGFDVESREREDCRRRACTKKMMRTMAR